jgi:hypothetical protein
MKSRIECISARFNTYWYILQPLSYDLGLIVWAVGLWSYSPPRIPRGNMEIETKSRLASIIPWEGSGRLVSLRQDS